MIGGPCGGQPGALPRGGKAYGKGGFPSKRKMPLKGLRKGGYIQVTYREKKNPGMIEEKVEYEGKIIDKRVGWDNRESYVELENCIRLNEQGEIIAKEGVKRLFDAFIEECEEIEKVDRPLCAELREAAGGGKAMNMGAMGGMNMMEGGFGGMNMGAMGGMNMMEAMMSGMMAQASGGMMPTMAMGGMPMGMMPMMGMGGMPMGMMGMPMMGMMPMNPMGMMPMGMMGGMASMSGMGTPMMGPQGTMADGGFATAMGMPNGMMGMGQGQPALEPAPAIQHTSPSVSGPPGVRNSAPVRNRSRSRSRGR